MERETLSCPFLSCYVLNLSSNTPTLEDRILRSVSINDLFHNEINVRFVVVEDRSLLTVYCRIVPSLSFPLEGMRSVLTLSYLCITVVRFVELG